MANPYRTLTKACQVATAGAVIGLGSGTFTEAVRNIAVPAQVSIQGNGTGSTVIKINSSQFYNNNVESYDYSLDKAILNLASGSFDTTGNQTLRDFQIDGDSRQAHGGIFCERRNGVTMKNLYVSNFNFFGIFFRETENFTLQHCRIIDCSDSTSIVSSGAVTFGSNKNTIIRNNHVNEGRGYGFKMWPPSGDPSGIVGCTTGFTFQNNYVTVTPASAFGGGGIPNISLEMHDGRQSDIKIFDNYFDQTVSLVHHSSQPLFTNGTVVWRVTGNTFQIDRNGSGTNNFGYPLEHAISNSEVAYNFMKYGGDAVIVSWNDGDTSVKRFWNIHHNVIWPTPGSRTYPLYVVRVKDNVLQDLTFNFNTIYFPANSNNTTVIVGNNRVNVTTHSNWTVRSNIVVDLSTSNPYWNSDWFHLESGCSVSGILCTHNIAYGNSLNTGYGGTYNNNLTADPNLKFTGAQPFPYFEPNAGSNAIGSAHDGSSNRGRY